MQLVIHKVVQFEHIDVPNGGPLLEWITRSPVTQDSLALFRQTSFRQRAAGRSPTSASPSSGRSVFA